MKNTAKGAFGGQYNHAVIKELRAELAKSRLMLSALIEHTKTDQTQLLSICAQFVAKQRDLMQDNKRI
jgi:hypothetical protein